MKNYRYYATNDYSDVLNFDRCFNRLKNFEFKKDTKKYKYVIKAYFDKSSGDLTHYRQV